MNYYDKRGTKAKRKGPNCYSEIIMVFLLKGVPHDEKGRGVLMYGKPV
ncbi:hypothetical protein CCACVL1_27220, partial [Corchorus capsularis]